MFPEALILPVVLKLPVTSVLPLEFTFNLVTPPILNSCPLTVPPNEPLP